MEEIQIMEETQKQSNYTENQPDVNLQEDEIPDKKPDKTPQSRKWLLTFQKSHIDSGFTHERIKEEIKKIKPVVYWCLASEIGLLSQKNEDAEPQLHTHLFIFCSSPVRGSTLENRFPTVNREVCRGTAQENRDYIMKTGKHENTEKALTRIEGSFEEEGIMPIEPKQGKRTDLEVIQNMLDIGMTPNEIFDVSLSHRKFEKLIKDANYRKRSKETQLTRDITVIWHVGEAGSGKSFFINKLAELHGGEENIYIVGEYEKGFDKYNGESVLFLDELRTQLNYHQLLTILGGLKVQTYARYANIIGLWTEVHITSVYSPEQLYRLIVGESKQYIDTYEQLRRRISSVMYHYIMNGEYLIHEVPMSAYVNYERLKVDVSLMYARDNQGNKESYKMLREIFGATPEPIKETERPKVDLKKLMPNKGKGKGVSSHESSSENFTFKENTSENR